MEGTAVLSPLDWKQGNRIELEWDSLNLDSLGFISEPFNLFSSKTSGTLQASFSDLSLDSIEGQVDISVFPRVETKIMPEKIPVSGEANILVGKDSLQGEWRIENIELAKVLPSLYRIFGNDAQRVLSPLSLKGSLNLQGDLGGSLHSPEVRTEFVGEHISLAGLDDLSVLGKLNYRRSTLEIDSTMVLDQHEKVTLSGSFPLSPVDMMNLRISGEGLSLEKIQSLSGKVIPARGLVNLSASVIGNPKEPQVQGDLSCENFVLYGEQFDRVVLSFSLRDKKIELESLLASKSDGYLKASGWYDLRTKEHSSQFSVDSLSLDGWQPPGGFAELKMVVDLSGKSQGPLYDPQLLAEGVLSDFTLGDLDIGDVRIHADMKEKKVDFRVDAPLFGSSAHGALLLVPPFRLEADMESDLPFERLSSFYPVFIAENLSGQFGAQLNITADLTQPATTWNIQGIINRFLIDSGLFQIQNVRPIAFAADSNVLSVEDFQFEGNGLNIEGNGSLSWVEGGNSNLTVLADVDLALLSDLFQDISAEGSLKIDSYLQGGPLRDSNLKAGLTLSAGRIELVNFPEVFNDIGIHLEVNDDQIEIQSCVFDLGGTEFSLEGILPFQSLPVSLPFLSSSKEKKQVDLRAGFKNFNSSLLKVLLGGNIVQQLEGTMDADILIQGAKLQLPELSASMKTESFVLKVAGLQLEQDKPMEVRLDQGRFIVSPFSMSGPNSRLKVGGSIGLMETNDLDLDVEGESDFGILQGVMKDIQTQGKCGFNLRLTGDMSAPLFGGIISVQNAGATFGPPHFFLENFSGQIQIEDNRLLLKDFGGQLNGGKVEIGGEAGLEAWSLSKGEITLTAEDVLFDISRSLRSQLSSDLKFNFSADEKILSGKVEIQHGLYSEDINLESTFFRMLRRGSPLKTAVREVNPWIDNLQLQVGVTSLNPFLIETNLLNSQISAAVNLTGTFQQPGLTGRLESLEGGKLYFGKNTFLIRLATVDFINPRRIEPDLNVTAVTKVGEFEITLTLSGTPDDLMASLTSEPSLTEPNIVSLLVTGITLEGTATSLLNATGIEALSYLDSVLTGRLESALEKGLGLDSVRIDSGMISSIDNPAARITFQQHLSRNLELVYSQNLQAVRNRLWALDYNPLRSVNVQGIKKDNNEWSFFFRHDVSFGLKPMEKKTEERKRKIVENVVLENSPVFPENKILNRLHLKPGSRYDHFKLVDGLDRLRKMYARHFFLNPTLTTKRTEKDGKMQIALQILTGPKVIFEFLGDKVTAKLKKDALRLWMRTPYDRLAIGSIEESFQKHFIDKRYYQATVSHAESTGKDGEKRVVFNIVQGPRFKNPTLIFEGNSSISTKQLEGLIRRAPDFHLLFIDPPSILRRMRNFYVQNGFLQVQLDKPMIKFYPKEKTLNVTFPIKENPRFKIGKLDFEGNAFFSEIELEEILNIRKESYYNRDDVEKAAFALKEAYADKGFNKVELDISTQEDEKKESIDLSVKIQENMQGRVGEIHITGNTLTSEKVITRGLELQIGDLIDHRLLNKSRKQLYDLGIFKQVQIEAVPLESTSQSVRPYRIEIAVVEFQPFRLRYGLQYDTETSLGLSLELINRNLFGRSLMAGSSFRLNQDEKDFKGFVRSPYFLSKKISTEFFIFYNSSDKPSFNLDRGGLTIQQQMKLGRFSILSYGYSYEKVWTHLSETSVDPYATDTIHNEGVLNLAFSHDTRDNIMNASRGLFLSQSFGYAAGWIGSQVNFIRYFGELYSYQKISGSFIYAFAFRLGLGQGLGSELSLSQRFFAGGGTTLRGFKKNEVGPKNFTSGLAQGGDAVLIMNHELRFPLYKKWSGAVFLDMGNVYGRLQDFNAFNLREAAGFGLRFKAGFILIRMDWGFKLDRRPGESLSSIFFSIGQVF
ncbi:MAG: outer membrane protein assembly factor BamA [Candidatus Aminicenantes bacterium]|nr:outer membrane protein assembly factor BamA [Candidatus Aminicenantes bacterium]